MTALKPVEGSAGYDLSDYDFGYGDLDAVIAKGVTEAVRNGIECDSGLVLEIEFEDDGAILTVALPFGERGAWVKYETTLLDLIAECIRYEATPEQVRTARDCLLALASGLHKISNAGTDEPIPDYTEYVMPDRMLHTIKEQLDFLDEQIGVINKQTDQLAARKTHLENYKNRIHKALEGSQHD